MWRVWTSVHTDTILYSDNLSGRDSSSERTILLSSELHCVYVSTTVARGAYGSLAKLAARRGLGEFADLSPVSGTRPSCRTVPQSDMVMHIQETCAQSSTRQLARNTLVSATAFML